MVIAPIIRAAVKGVSTGMGLAGEKYYDHKERKATLSEREKSPNGSTDSSVEQLVNLLQPGDESASDQRIWALDEAAGEPPSYEESGASQRPVQERTVSELVHNVLGRGNSGTLPQMEQSIRLPHPIVIPQRRPGARGRGFARAFPPDMEAFGMDEAAFLRFLQSFQDASEAAPWLKALYISANAVGLVPGHITMAVSLSLSIAAGTAIELQSRYRANVFLDQMNKEVFMPMGLYCMVLLCKDGPSAANNPEFGIETVNLETAKQVSKWGLPKEKDDEELNLPTKNKILRPIRMASGITKATEMPLEIAPLTYPGLEDMVQRPQIRRDESFKDRLMRNKEFVADYFDRRARADYAGNNPNSALTKTSDNPEFRTRFADPNHPCNNGHLFSLVTGGNYVAQPRGRKSRLREVGEDGKLKPRIKHEHKIRGPISLVGHGVRKVFTPNVLYLTIVNMPSEEELREARLALGMEEKGIAEMVRELSKEDSY
ncbi:hypothetical protein K458DRAFT_370860 [Lentithecium fluviatile CBS 122367]|uniref:Uncharacterized protein n=1 Tax=Lentithecium fluviatile CBS 122367 TaxID=1168545 RepID=A0A6G1IVQ4_9PLEO|nr:hypothetical protein K458DRAFT_370860 [Lentithecium fluviatile CBS 122367]